MECWSAVHPTALGCEDQSSGHPKRWNTPHSKRFAPLPANRPTVGDIPGGTSSSYNIASVQASNSGSYTVTVTNSYGAVTSAPAILSLTPLDIRLCAVLTIDAPVGSHVQVDYTESLSQPAWLPLTNLTLPFSPFPYICDWDSSNRTKRFYRVVLP